jgi:hypothetical protein
MSLINDALKRASQSDKDRPGQAPPPRPIEPVVGGQDRRLSWILAAFVAIALLMAGWFFLKWMGTGRSAVVATTAPAPAGDVVAAPAPPPPPPVVAQSPPPPAKPAEPILAAPVAPVVEAPWPAPLTLQGIFYNKTAPRALISGKTVGLGDTVNGVRVAGIESDRVVVEWNGQTKELVLEGQ